jgi:hypothetical protein
MDTTLNVFLFELGKVQFFTKLTSEELVANVDHKDIYWVHNESVVVHGPFKTIYEAVTHYTGVIASEKNPSTPIPGDKPVAPVIYVDFTTKRRVEHG